MVGSAWTENRTPPVPKTKMGIVRFVSRCPRGVPSLSSAPPEANLVP